jgi:hypothetical protein
VGNPARRLRQVAIMPPCSSASFKTR